LRDRRTALEDLLGIPPERINDDRLYRALDELLPHKEELEKHRICPVNPMWLAA
jgi:hypothetical protein